MKRIIFKYWFVILFVITISYCTFGFFIDQKIELSGVTSSFGLEKFSMKNILSGGYQSSVTNFWDQKMPGKKLLIKLRSQAMYSILDESPNSSVSMGKSNTLFEDVYITNEIGTQRVTDSNYFKELNQKLERLNNLMEKNGKLMYIFITPSKAHYFSSDVPWQFSLVNKDLKESNNYVQFKQMLKNTDLKYFDSRKYIDEHSQEKIKAPLFYRTGIHWSTSWGQECAIAFANYISSTSNWNLGNLSLQEEPTDTPQWPDADLYQSLNLIQKPKLDYYQAKINVDKEGDKPNVFLRGGSFMGCSLGGLIREGVFKKDVYLENNYYFTNRYSESKSLSSYTAYDEMPLKEMFGNKDILILEVNEAAIESMSFGFIDYMLDNSNQILGG